MRDPEYLAIELEGVAALLNGLSLQYHSGKDRLSEEENENALNAVQQQLFRIAADLEAYSRGETKA